MVAEVRPAGFFVPNPRALVFAGFFLIILQLCLSAQTPAAPTPAAAKSTLPTDPGWPRKVAKDGAQLLYYQPQVDHWKDFKELTGQVAFSLTPRVGKEVHGVASFHAFTEVDKVARTVVLHDIEATSIRFPSLDATTTGPMEELFRTLLPTGGEPISLDRLLADLEHDKHPAKTVSVKNDPPPIFFSTGPALLLVVDGKPVLSPIENTDLEFVVNTNWDLFFEKSRGNYYLLAGNVWQTAKDPAGPWQATQSLPKDMSKLPERDNWTDVKKAVPAQKPAGPVQQVFFSSTPAELLLFRGEPAFIAIKGTHLRYASNTDSDVFIDDSDKAYYVLLSGRWFKSQSLKGAWTYTTDHLPSDFSQIPEGSPRERVLASVPGTLQASDAVMLAQVPTTVTVNKAEAEKVVKVSYNGEPQFKPIEKTSLQYATNTQEKVIRDGDLYYLCFQGIWFMSTTPTGPWKTADSVPKEIYTIPPSSPVYNVTYVTQTNPTVTTVESSTTAGYLGMFVIGASAGACIAFGTGYYYPPFVYWGPVYPIYYPWPRTYGAAAVYNPWTGGFAVGHAAYGPYGAVGSAAWYNPATGRYGRAASVQGWYGGRTVATGYNPWTGGYGGTVQNRNPYAQWGHSTGVRNGNVIQTGHVSTAGGTVAGYRTSSGDRGVAYRGAAGSVVRTGNYTYAGRDGNVYRKDTSGNWSQYSGSGWNSVDTSAAKERASQSLQSARSRSGISSINSSTLDSLNRSSLSRQRGQFQTQRFHNFRMGGGRFRR